MHRPLAIDLFSGLHGWADGLIAEGFRVVGFDLEDMSAQFGQAKPEHFHLVIQDVLTLHGSQFKNAALIVASPPCQEYSYMGMPWTRAKALAADYRAGRRDVKQLTALFDTCFRLQREACEAAGRKIPMVVENVKGAQPWVGRSRWNYGSYHLWGDVPALMPLIFKANKNTSGSWFNIGSPGQKELNRNPVHVLSGRKLPGFRFDGSGRSFQTAPLEGTKIGGDWFSDPTSTCRRHGSKSPARKMASAMIAKIPLPLSRHIARCWYPLSEAA